MSKGDLGTVLMTGGTSGIGAELLRIWLGQGRRVIVLARRAAALSPSPGLLPVVCDLADSPAVARLADRIVRDHPDITLLANVAAVQYAFDLSDPATTPVTLAEEAAVNLVAPAILSHAVLQQFISRGGGTILNVSSGLAVFPKERAGLYAATKAGLHSFSQSLRYQVERHNIQVTEAILPLVDTPMTEGRGGGKLPAAQVAAAIAKAVERGQEEIWIGKARLLPVFSRLAPGLGRVLMRGT